MDITANIGKGHFFTNIERLPNEEVLWEGGVSQRGEIVRYFRISLPALFLMTMAVFLLDMAFHLPSPSRPSNTCPATETTDVPVLKNTHKTREPDPLKVSPLLILISGGLLLLSCAAIIEIRLSNRNAWYVVTNERICIQSGVIGRYLTVIDIDKVLSVQVMASWLERRFGLQTIEFIQAGVRIAANNRIMARDRVRMELVLSKDQLASNLLNSWLLRDNRRNL